jgi:hypothetical protein
VTSSPLPTSAAWRHVGAQDGFETVFLRTTATGSILDGHTTAIEDGVTWAVHYTVEVDEHWVTRLCRVRSWSAVGERETLLAHDPVGRWRVDGVLVPELDECLDADLEASACTNMLPVRRAELSPGGSVRAPAAYVRAPGLEIERLEQSYTRLADDDDGHTRYAYRAPRFRFECELQFAPDGLVVDYPGIATRVA